MRVYDVFAEGVGLAALRERYRFSAPWQGARMFSVFTGAIVTDTAPKDTTDVKPVVRTRFFVAGVDSMRAPRSGDCAGVK
jgi:hypothetical protein